MRCARLLVEARVLVEDLHGDVVAGELEGQQEASGAGADDEDLEVGGLGRVLSGGGGVQ